MKPQKAHFKTELAYALETYSSLVAPNMTRNGTTHQELQEKKKLSPATVAAQTTLFFVCFLKLKTGLSDLNVHHFRFLTTFFFFFTLIFGLYLFLYAVYCKIFS